nr:NAD(P)H-hydrate dehydratase [Actinomycetes bacterium]
VLLIGAGNNGGDTLFAGAALAQRGAWVLAIPLAAEIHPEGAAALLAQGGRLAQVPYSDEQIAEAVGSLRRADLVLDGIVGIGGQGPLREPAATLVRAIEAADTIRVAVDIPSGVDPATGQVPDSDSVFAADLTVTFGALKSGLVLPPGRDFAGRIVVVPIGLQPQLAALPDIKLLQANDVAPFVPAPAESSYKYSHGVVGVVAGSSAYPGAAQMVTGAARHTGVGMVRIADRDDGVAQAVVNRFPDVVATDGNQLANDPRATAWVIGPGADTGHQTATDLAALLSTELPVVVDADAITVVANDPELREQIKGRSATTVLTPHVGEFRRLGFELTEDRLGSASAAADQMGAIVVLKGPGTVIAGPSGKTYVDPIGPAALATAGTGDALAGIVGGILAQDPRLPNDDVRAVAAAVYLHGLAARVASAGDRPITSWDLTLSVQDAVAQLRSLASVDPDAGISSD